MLKCDPFGSCVVGSNDIARMMHGPDIRVLNPSSCVTEWEALLDIFFYQAYTSLEVNLAMYLGGT